MLLVIDIGNSNIVTGIYRDDQLVLVNRLKTEHARTVDEYWVLLRELWRAELGDEFKFSRAVICSVVPPLTGVFQGLCEERLAINALVVGPGIKTGLTIKTSDPAAVGADRVVNSIAAREIYGSGSIVIDFGTATTFDVVDDSGAYCGGAIAPGLQIALDALVSRTAKLPRIELTWPQKSIGSDTVSAMRSGCILGYACLVAGLVRRMQAEMPGLKRVIATGGLARRFADSIDCIEVVDEELTLKGLKLIAKLNS